MPYYIPQAKKEHAMNYLIIATGSFLFCTKGVVAKLCYREGLDALDVMLLRMLLSLPLFIALAIYGSRGRNALTKKDWLALFALGFSGYYLTSFLDFKGLEYIDVGLERMILFLYPLIILFLSRFTKVKTSINKQQWVAAIFVWIGITIAFSSYLTNTMNIRDIAIGSALVFASALLFAIYSLFSKPWIDRIGVARFAGIVMSVSAVCVITHSFLTKEISSNFNYPPKVYLYGITIAIFGTFIPQILTVLGIKRTSPQVASIIGSVGPVSAVILSATFLDEKITPILVAGFCLSLVGTIIVQSAKKKST